MDDASHMSDMLMIHQLYGVFAIASSRPDKERWLSCWAEGASWKTSFFDVAGKDEISQKWDLTWKSFKSVTLMQQVGEIVISDGTAKTEVLCLDVFKLNDGEISNKSAIYNDELVKVDGKWKISSRVLTPLS